MTALTMSKCAVRADNTLKEASEINWFNNIDDNKPISELAANPIPSSLSTTLYPIFTGSRAPATFVAGTCHSSHVSHCQGMTSSLLLNLPEAPRQTLKLERGPGALIKLSVTSVTCHT